MSGLSSNDPIDRCNVQVIYQFVAKNVGTKQCEEVTSIDINYLGGRGDELNIPQNSWSTSKNIFCRNESLTINQPVEDNLCKRNGDEVAFGVRMNNSINQEIGTISFPTLNEAPGPS